MAAEAGLDITTTVKLNDGREMPMFGLGVFMSGEGDECENAVQWALKAGYRHIDTAHFYQNELSVGKGLAASGVPREQVWITTKVWTSHHGYEPALESAAESLEKLGVDYVDLLLIHAPVGPNEAKRLDTWRALEKLKADGKARSIGVSNYGAHHIQEILDAGTVVPAVNQVELHPWCARKELVEFCRSKEIAVEGYCPLARCRKFDDERLAKLCAETGKTEAQICIRWALQHGFITIPKSSNEGRISSNADVFSWSLTEAQMAMLDDFDEDYHVSWDPTVSA